MFKISAAKLYNVKIIFLTLSLPKTIIKSTLKDLNKMIYLSNIKLSNLYNIKMKDSDNIFSFLRNNRNFLSILNRDEKPSDDHSDDVDFFKSNNSYDFFNTSSLNISRDSIESFQHLRSKNDLHPSDFILQEQIGCGAYGKVYKAKSIHSGQFYAIKVLDKKHLQKLNKYYQIANENDILSLLCHENIVEIYGAYEDMEKAYLVLEYCAYGDLQCLIKKYCKFFIKLLVPFNINVIKFIIAQIIESIEYLREHRIIHRDIKPDNLVINENFVLKLVNKLLIFKCDFSNSYTEIHLLQGRSMNIFMGTPEYMAPEVINDGVIGSYTDYWSLGIILYKLFTGHTPFKDNTEYLIFEKVLKTEPMFNNNFTPEAIDLISSLLSKNPEDRIFDIRRHAFFKNFNPDSCINDIRRIITDSSNTNIDYTNLNYQMPNLLFEIDNSPSCNLIKQGVLKKKSPWFQYYNRLICLYDYPKIEYLDPQTNTVKGTVYLDKSCKAELISFNKFELRTPNRTFTFKCIKKKGDIMSWISAINDVIEKYA
jgi:3-phosphoinositide dependent protein kinase-1